MEREDFQKQLLAAIEAAGAKPIDLATPSRRTTHFRMLSVDAPPDVPVLFVETSEGMYTLARVDDVQRLVFATVSYLMNQWRGRAKSSYHDFLEEFDADPPGEEHLPEPALGMLKEFIDDILG